MFRWLENATESEPCWAAFELAQIDQEGDGVPADRLKARDWFKVAADSGHPQARKR